MALEDGGEESQPSGLRVLGNERAPLPGVATCFRSKSQEQLADDDVDREGDHEDGTVNSSEVEQGER